MQSIQIDEQVFAELEHRAMGFNVTPNDVLRRVLNLVEPASATPSLLVTASQTVASKLPQFIRSERFQRHSQAIDRYLAILSWLHSAQQKQFSDVVSGFRRGKRVYFAKSEKEILDSGDGVTARQIPQSPFWALVTLDNKSKRGVLEHVLKALDYSLSETGLVLAELPDSGIKRSQLRHFNCF